MKNLKVLPAKTFITSRFSQQGSSKKLLIIVLLLAIAAVVYWLYSNKQVDNAEVIETQSKFDQTREVDRAEIKASINEIKNHVHAENAKKVVQVSNKTGPIAPADAIKVGDSYQFGTNGLQRDFGKAIHYYQMAASTYFKQNNMKGAGKACLLIGRLYKNGGSEVPPDAFNSIIWLKKALYNGYEDALLDIGDIYMNGLHPYYLPDKVMAGQIFNTASTHPRFSHQAKAVARKRMKEIASLHYMDIDTLMEQDGRSYKPLPGDIIQELYDLISSSNAPIVATSVSKSVIDNAMRDEEMERRANELVVNLDDIDTNLQEMLWNDLTERHRRDNAAVRNGEVGVLADIPTQQGVENDSQNVHSSSVQTAASRKIDYLLQNTKNLISPTLAKNDFLSAIRYIDGITEEQRSSIEKVVNTMKDSKHSRYGRSENDIFAIVWSRINDPANQDRRNDMIKVLAQNLESAFEHGHVVCSTGKIVRTIGSLDGMDKAEEMGAMPVLKPEWVIEKEFAELAAKIRGDVLAAADNEARTAYDAVNPSEDQRRIAQELSHKMQFAFKERTRKDYQDTRILDADMLALKIGTYLENL